MSIDLFSMRHMERTKRNIPHEFKGFIKDHSLEEEWEIYEALHDEEQWGFLDDEDFDIDYLKERLWEINMAYSISMDFPVKLEGQTYRIVNDKALKDAIAKEVELSNEHEIPYRFRKHVDWHAYVEKNRLVANAEEYLGDGCFYIETGRHHIFKV